MEAKVNAQNGQQIAIEIRLAEAVLVQHILPGVEAWQVRALPKAG